MILAGAGRIQPKLARPRTGTYWLIGHRGYPFVAPENTIASFHQAIEVGLDMVEFDVTLTKDRVAVVFHDRTLSRTTNGRGAVRKKRFDQLRALDAGIWFSKEFEGEPIPTFENVLDAVKGRISLNVEIKREAVGRKISGGVEEQVVSALEKKGLAPFTVVSSFFPLAIRRVKELNPRQSTAILLHRHARRDPRIVVDRVGADAVHMPFQRLTERIVQNAAKEEIPIRVFTVNKIETMRRLVEWGVDGLFSDRGDRLVQLMLTSGKAGPGLAMK